MQASHHTWQLVCLREAVTAPCEGVPHAVCRLLKRAEVIGTAAKSPVLE